YTSARKATRIVTGNGTLPHIPTSMIVLPTTETRRCFPASTLATTLVDGPTTARAISIAPAQTHQLCTWERARIRALSFEAKELFEDIVTSFLEVINSDT